MNTIINNLAEDKSILNLVDGNERYQEHMFVLLDVYAEWKMQDQHNFMNWTVIVPCRFWELLQFWVKWHKITDFGNQAIARAQYARSILFFISLWWVLADKNWCFDSPTSSHFLSRLFRSSFSRRKQERNLNPMNSNF